MAPSLASYPAAEAAPALPISSPLRFLRESRTDRLGLFARWAAIGGVARLQTRRFVSHLVSEPAAVQRILKDNPKNYLKEVRSARLFRVALGGGLFLAEGDAWRSQRRVAQPAFHRPGLEAMTATMTDLVRAMMERWEPRAASGEPFDLGVEAMELAVDVVGRCLCGADLRSEAAALSRALSNAFDYFSYTLGHIVAPPRFLPTARNRRFRHALREIDRVTYGVIEQGRKREESAGDLLSMMIEAYDPPERAGGQNKELRDNLAGFLGTGTETTAVSLTWVWYLLSKHPEVERRLRAEANQVIGEGVPAFDDLSKLKYTRMVIDESLRLYPPAWVITRTAITDDVVCGFRIPAGTSLFVSPWATHRSPRYWDNPDEFDPERFSPERSAGRHEYAYYPFGAGPRVCVGDRFSLMEQVLTIAMVAQRFRVAVVEDHPIVPDPAFTLRPKDGIRATLHKL